MERRCGGWQDDNRLDGIKRKYVKWILKLDWRIPNYILIEETKINEIKFKIIRRTVKYEERIGNSRKKLIKECIKELEKDSRGKEGDWEKKRREVLERAGMSKKQIRRVREAGDQGITEDLMKRLERRGKEERQDK